MTHGDRLDQAHANDVAIVGMAARVPGASDVATLWRNLRDGIEAVQRYTEAELIQSGEPRELLRSKRYVPAGAPLPDMEMFDAELFGLSAKEAAIMDPQHRQFLEAAWEALEHAGIPPRTAGVRRPIGVWAGCGPNQYLALNLFSRPELLREVGFFLLRHGGNDKDFLPTRVSYLFDLAGPSIAVQTACSSSLTAIHLACQSLLSGEVDAALAGGVTIELPHRRGYLYEEGEILSPDGHCRAFDHRAQGPVFGSGAGVVVLKRAEDALRDGDMIWALIRGTAVNNDGAGKVSFLAPSVDGQARCMVECYSIAQVGSETIDLVECHGTGTYLGDPIEVAALSRAFAASESSPRRERCRIGSIKSNIGHLDTAAGVAALIKAALSLHHRQMPPTLGFERPNPSLEIDETPFEVNERLRDWPVREHRRRAAVNSLGVGGTNAHAVLEEAPGREPGTPSKRRHQLITLSAASLPSLDESSRRLAAHLSESSVHAPGALPAGPVLDLADVAHTLASGRAELGRRRVLAASDLAEAARLLSDRDPRRVVTETAVPGATSIAFAFPGGGAQYARMGAELYEHEPVFREHLDRGLELLRTAHGIDLRPLLFCDRARLRWADDELETMRNQLPAIFLIEHALAELWRSFGVEPELLVGHSLGENTAACVAGVMSLPDALGLVVLRGQLLSEIEGGAMSSVPLSAEDLTPLLDGLDIGVRNAASVTVVSGPVARVAALEETLAARGIEARRIAVPVAAHSRMLEPILDRFRSYLRSIRLSPPRIPLLSNRDGRVLSDARATDPEYWVQHLRGTVDFAACIETLLTDLPDGDVRVLVEVGPGRALSSLAKLHPRAASQLRVVGSLRHRDEEVPDDAFFLTQLGRLWAVGASFDRSRLHRGERRLRVPLPTYAFEHRRYFIEPGKGRDAAGERSEVLKEDSIARWGWSLEWAPRAAPPPGDPKAQTWLFFMDGAGLGRRVATQLLERGHTVISVYEGDSFTRRGEHEYTLAPERGREGYAALLSELVKRGLPPSRIAHLWLVTTDERFRPGSSFFHRNQERGFYSLLFLAQAISEEGVVPPLHITTIASGMAQVDGELVRYPEKATVLGPARVIPRELAGVTCSVLDVEMPTPSGPLFGGSLARALIDPAAGRRSAEAALDRLAARVFAELSAPASNATIAIRSGRRYERMLAPLPLPGTERAAAIREGAVVLVTGGLGGIGSRVAIHLAESRRAKLVLIGRSPLPPRSDWDAWIRTHGPSERTSEQIAAVRAMERAGAEVMVAAGDVTIESDLREVLEAARQRFGPVEVVIHAAGVLRDGLIPQKTQGECEDVFTPKIHGTLVLDRALAGYGVRQLILFSSTSTALAPPGQVDYVAANAFLDAFAASRRARGLPALSIGWGIWAEAGMARAALAREEGAEVEVIGSIEAPMLDARVRLPEGATALVAHYQSSRWFLDEHRTAGGDAVMPGTGYLELAREALIAEGELGAAFELRDLFFFRPLAVPDDETKEVRVRMTRTESGYAMEVSSRIDLDGRSGWHAHAQAQIALAPIVEPAQIDLPRLEQRTGRVDRDEAGIATPQAQFLRFGPRWRVLREVRWGEGEALARLALPSRFAGELPELGLHPALLDLATGFAMELIPGYDASSLWVPVSYEVVRVHAPFSIAESGELRSWVRYVGSTEPSDVATFHVTITDREGHVLIEIERFSIKRTTSGLSLSTSPSDVKLAPAASESPAVERLRRSLEQGILTHEGLDAFERALELAGERSHVFVSSMDLGRLTKQMDASPRDGAESDAPRFERPSHLSSEYLAPRDDLERTLVGFYQELLGLDSVGVRDSFFDLGGHSLIAVRLFAKIKRAYACELPMSVLFEAPTVERVAALLRERAGITAPASSSEEGPRPAMRPRYSHLVTMHPGRDEGLLDRNVPFFIVAGMFGNVLNLRHLAHLIGTDRRFYGIEARGLHGESAPHDRVDEMARAYLAELRSVQPRGPYLLGGFSGGGITALEMAQQLRAAGEEVALLAMLDTPLPHRPPLSARDRLEMQLEELKRKGPLYVREWVDRRIQWEVQRMRRRFEEPEQDVRADAFRSESVGNAFRAALVRYSLQRYEGKVTLFRPRLRPWWVLSNGRMISAERHYLLPDNGWTPWVRELEVHEVPGDHDSMVLEPNVRVLARKLRACIDALHVTTHAPGPHERSGPRMVANRIASEPLALGGE